MPPLVVGHFWFQGDAPPPKHFFALRVQKQICCSEQTFGGGCASQGACTEADLHTTKQPNSHVDRNLRWLLVWELYRTKLDNIFKFCQQKSIFMIFFTVKLHHWCKKKTMVFTRRNTHSAPLLTSETLWNSTIPPMCTWHTPTDALPANLNNDPWSGNCQKSRRDVVR